MSYDIINHHVKVTCFPHAVRGQLTNSFVWRVLCSSPSTSINSPIVSGQPLHHNDVIDHAHSLVCGCSEVGAVDNDCAEYGGGCDCIDQSDGFSRITGDAVTFALLPPTSQVLDVQVQTPPSDVWKCDPHLPLPPPPLPPPPPPPPPQIVAVVIRQRVVRWLLGSAAVSLW